MSMGMYRNWAAGLVLVALAGYAGAGAKVDGWIIDDFDGYSSQAELKATGFGSGGPWWLLQELQAVLGMITIPAQTKLSIDLVEDPNAFIASGEIADPNHPGKAVKVHYELSTTFDCDLFRFSNTLGIPYQIIATGQPAPLDYLPVVDFTAYDRLSIKIMNQAGNHSLNDDFVFSLVGPDAEAIGLFPPRKPAGKFMEYPAGVWTVVEFDLNGQMNKGSSAFGRDMVSGITFGSKDSAGAKVTYYVDDIMLYNKSIPCDSHQPADLNLDCSVDLEDLALLAAGWMGT